ncbi:MAG: type II toxin-antitoxin system VapC family toxin [Phycisphaeraceae bacterium]|nr:type II toxin-antitoxin system VapC family toxin [Phycisphaeraceae bacterium]
MPERVYWDTNCFLGWFQQEPNKRDALRELLNRAEADEMVIVTSAITITECAGLPTVRRVDDAASKKILAFFEQEYIALRSVERQIAERAHDLTRKLAIKHADAIHVATAALSNVRVLHTWDEGMLKHSGSAGIGVPIERPPDPSKGTIFDKAR